MTWAEAVIAMKRGHYVRRPMWSNVQSICFENNRMRFTDAKHAEIMNASDDKHIFWFDFLTNDLSANDWETSKLVQNGDGTDWTVIHEDGTCWKVDIS